MMCGGLDKRIACIIALAMLVQTACADSIDLIDAQVIVNNQGDAFISQVASFNSEDLKTVSFDVGSPQILRVYDFSGDLPYTTDDGKVTVEARQAENDYSLTLEYVTSELTTKNGQDWRIDIGKPSVEDIDSYILTLKMPSDSSIKSQSGDGIVSTEDGVLIIEWFTESIDDSGVGSFNVEYSMSRTELTTTTVPTSEVPSTTLKESADKDDESQGILVYVIIGLIVIAVLILGFVVFIWYFKGKDSSTRMDSSDISEGKKDIMVTLNKNEREIIQVLICSEGKLTQAEIFRKTGIPKATLSRSLRNLESRKILEVREIGYTNLVVLTDWFMSK